MFPCHNLWWLLRSRVLEDCSLHLLCLQIKLYHHLHFWIPRVLIWKLQDRWADGFALINLLNGCTGACTSFLGFLFHLFFLQSSSVGVFQYITVSSLSASAIVLEPSFSGLHMLSCSFIYFQVSSLYLELGGYFVGYLVSHWWHLLERLIVLPISDWLVL